MSRFRYSPRAMTAEVKRQIIKYTICLLLVAVAFSAFAFVSHCSFIVFDDGTYIFNNTAIQNGVTWEAIKWAFQNFDSSNWHPLTWLSHMLDCQWFALDPAGPHLINLTFHIANTLLLFLLLHNLTGRLWPAAFAAMLFAIHPMHVESVAWVSERKDVLSAFFFLLTLLAYARYVELRRKTSPPPGVPPPVSATFDKDSKIRVRTMWMAYGLAVFFFALGLMSKPMVVTVPFALLLLDFWPLQRIASKHSEDESTVMPRGSRAKAVQRLLVEKIPFFILAAASCVVTYIAQNTGGAVKSQFDYPLAERLTHVPVAYGWYIFKLFWPANLSVFYILRPGQDSGLEMPGATWFLLLVTFVAVVCIRKYPFFIVGWLWFLGMLVPVIGLVQVGNQAYADRYTYLPYIGLFIILAWGIPELLAKLPFRPLILGTGFLLVTVACFLQTVKEVHYWKNGLLLFGHAIEVDPKDETAWAILGSENARWGNDRLALDCYDHSLALNRNFNLVWHDAGLLLVREERYAEAEHAFRVSLENTRRKKDKVELNNDIGNVLVAEDKAGDAIAAYQNSLELSPDQPIVQTELGRLFFHENQYDQADAAFEKAIHLNPTNEEAQVCLGMILQGKGRDSEAIPHYRKAIEVNSNSFVALNNLSWLLATDPNPELRNGPEAVPLAQQACQQTGYKDVSVLGTLAAAFAEAGQFNDAVATAQKALQMADQQGKAELASSLQAQIKFYESRQPFRDTTLEAH